MTYISYRQMRVISTAGGNQRKDITLGFLPVPEHTAQHGQGLNISTLCVVIHPRDKTTSVTFITKEKRNIKRNIILNTDRGSDLL